MLVQNLNLVDFRVKVGAVSKGEACLLKPALLLVEICSCALFWKALLETFSQMNLVKTTVRNKLNSECLNSALRIRLSGISLATFNLSRPRHFRKLYYNIKN